MINSLIFLENNYL